MSRLPEGDEEDCGSERTGMGQSLIVERVFARIIDNLILGGLWYGSHVLVELGWGYPVASVYATPATIIRTSIAFVYFALISLKRGDLSEKNIAVYGW